MIFAATELTARKFMRKLSNSPNEQASLWRQSQGGRRPFAHGRA